MPQNKITLSKNQKRIIEKLNHPLYTVNYIQEWINRTDNVAINAPAALIACTATGFYAAVCQIEKAGGML